LGGPTKEEGRRLKKQRSKVGKPGGSFKSTLKKERKKAGEGGKGVGGLLTPVPGAKYEGAGRDVAIED